MINIDNKFDIGQPVYLVTEVEQDEHLVCALKITQNEILYIVTCGTEVSTHYDFELSATKRII